ncbi:FtsW/RodA/SpoVE family cell cycle protein [Gemelliphila palaticanis]|uniref:Probable peptidoglycan glycosyltransferase FtsW n=1 Tax=Gemelliphila palaticanis TaxID=81950 RepID=A0ABX2T1S4_9BACL|nr:FtsW/RodA/SpoVE family cell cycle protein [Gemella palaticanis]MBF0715225.1 FtsW/RodA/SpoVE family cell cycle protein [Gemella palaticanis]NYS47155.1 FtsW/RodA/SpoVE family cell cycle protein [Gemella palaticanis]
MNIKYLFKKSIIFEKRHKRIDIFITISFILLLFFSCIMVYSASMIGNKYGMFTGYVPVEPSYFLKRQVAWVALSLLSYFLFALFFPYEILKNKNLYFWGLFGIIILLLLPQLQTSVNGAKSWLRIGGFTFQTSTLAQIFLILYMSLILESRKYNLMRPMSLKHLSNIFWIPLSIMFFIFIQNDTGTMLITGAVLIIMVLCSNMSFKNIIKLLKIGTVSLILLFLIIFLKSTYFSNNSYQVNRFKVFLDPFYGTNDSNNQVVNSLIAFGNGGLFGRGLGNSIQKLGYLSEAHTDFILAITAEEFGFIGVIVLVALLITIIIKVMYAGIKSDNTFDSIFAIGFASLLLVQTIINIGGVTASLPLTGVPIPFFSYGGSSLLILSTTLGITVNLLSHVKYKKGGI